MVHHYQTGLIRRLREHVIEPAQPIRTQLATPFAGDQGVEPDDPQWVIIDHIIQKALPRQISVPGKGNAHRFARVMVAGDCEYRHAEGRQKGAQVGVFLRLTVLDKIAGKGNDLRQRIQPVER